MNFWDQKFSALGYKYGTNAHTLLVAQAYRLPTMAFHPSQLTHSSGGPKAPEMLYTLQTLQEDFAGVLTEVLAWEWPMSPAGSGGSRRLDVLCRLTL